MAMAVALHNIPEGLIVAGTPSSWCFSRLCSHLQSPLLCSTHLRCDRQQAAGAWHGRCVGMLRVLFTSLAVGCLR